MKKYVFAICIALLGLLFSCGQTGNNGSQKSSNNRQFDDVQTRQRNSSRLGPPPARIDDTSLNNIRTDCSELITKHYDEVEGITTYVSTDNSGFTDFEGGMYNWFVLKDGLIYWLFKLNKSNDHSICVSNGSSINILFEDNTRVQFINEETSNCNGVLHVNLSANLIAQNALLSTRVKIIRIYTNERYLDETDWNREKEGGSSTLIASLRCISNIIRNN